LLKPCCLRMVGEVGAEKPAPAQRAIQYKLGAKRIFLCAAAPSIFMEQTILRRLNYKEH
jgi:hypothetical protein